MKLVILTGRGPEHRAVTAALADAFPSELRAIIVADPPARSISHHVRRYVRRYSMRQLLSRVAARLADRLLGMSARRTRLVAKRLFPAGDSGRMPREEVLAIVPNHNGSSCLAILDSIEPDIIAVYGTSVLREPVTRRAKTATLNLHTGISPRYRGSDCVFWPLYNEEPEWIGVTVHALADELDAGPIYGTRRVAINVDDTEGTLFAKSVLVGAQLYTEVIELIQNGAPPPPPQTISEGREYRFVDRTIIAEWRVAVKLRRGLLRRKGDSTT